MYVIGRSSLGHGASRSPSSTMCKRVFEACTGLLDSQEPAVGSPLGRPGKTTCGELTVSRHWFPVARMHIAGFHKTRQRAPGRRSAAGHPGQQRWPSRSRPAASVWRVIRSGERLLLCSRSVFHRGTQRPGRSASAAYGADDRDQLRLLWCRRAVSVVGLAIAACRSW
jgi:hypothetical protein